MQRVNDELAERVGVGGLPNLRVMRHSNAPLTAEHSLTEKRTATAKRLLATACCWLPYCLDLDSFSVENGRMKTTVDIPENELRDAMRFTRAKTKREAVVKVLADFNRRRRMAELVKYAGTFSEAFPSNDDIEAVDARRARKLDARSR